MSNDSFVPPFPREFIDENRRALGLPPLASRAVEGALHPTWYGDKRGTFADTSNTYATPVEPVAPQAAGAATAEPSNGVKHDRSGQARTGSDDQGITEVAGDDSGATGGEVRAGADEHHEHRAWESSPDGPILEIHRRSAGLQGEDSVRAVARSAGAAPAAPLVPEPGVRAALEELVALKDLKDEELRMRQRRPVRDPQKVAQCDAMQAEYRSRKPAAWAAARAALSSTPSAPTSDPAPVQETKL